MKTAVQSQYQTQPTMQGTSCSVFRGQKAAFLPRFCRAGRQAGLNRCRPDAGQMQHRVARWLVPAVQIAYSNAPPVRFRVAVQSIWSEKVSLLLSVIRASSEIRHRILESAADETQPAGCPRLGEISSPSFFPYCSSCEN